MSEDAPMPPPQSPTPNPAEEDLLDGPSGKDHLAEIVQGWTRAAIAQGHAEEVKTLLDRFGAPQCIHAHHASDDFSPDTTLVAVVVLMDVTTRMAMTDAVLAVLADKLIPADNLEIATPFAEPGTPGVTDLLAFPCTVIVGGMQAADVKALRNTIAATTLAGGPVTVYFLSTRPLRTHFAGMWVDVPRGKLAHFKHAFVNKILTTPDFYTLFLRDRTRVPDPGGEHPLDYAGAVQVLAYHMHVDQITFNTRTHTRTQQPTVGTRAYILPFSLNNPTNIDAFYALFEAPSFEFRVGLSGYARLWRGPHPNKIEKVHCFQCLGIDHFAECCHIIESHAHKTSHPVDAPRVCTAAALVPAAQFIGPSTPPMRGQGERDNRGRGLRRKPY
uniref:Uncharacterized protein n=1 Tax=Mycena chlorophos TaxID=658473 RepID=A0ABQ0KW88_MYCCL|nr:predicted protein [Mycena chlorophos]